MARVEGEAVEAHGFPGLSWGPVIAGVLLALAAHVVMGLVGGALGFAAVPSDSAALGLVAALWGLLTPLVATLLGAWLACRLAGRVDEAGSNLHGVMVWCIGIIAGAIFLAGTGGAASMNAGSAASRNAGAVQRFTGDASARSDDQVSDESAKRAAATAGGGAMAGLCGLIGAFAGAAIARSRRRGQGQGRGLGWRIALQRTHPREGGRKEEAPVQHAERYPSSAEEVREVSRQEGPGAPADPYQH
jgi:hypothetical protein